MAEGRPFHLRPQAGAVGRHDQQPAFRRQHPPQLAQQRPQAFRFLQAMHHQHQIEERVGERQRVFLDQGGEAFLLAARRPLSPKRSRHGGDAAFGFRQKGAQIGLGKAITQQPPAPDIGPELAQAAQDQPPRPLPHGAVIEFAQDRAHPLRTSVIRSA